MPDKLPASSGPHCDRERQCRSCASLNMTRKSFNFISFQRWTRSNESSAHTDADASRNRSRGSGPSPQPLSLCGLTGGGIHDMPL